MNLTSFSRYVPRNGGGQFIQAKVDEAVAQFVTAWATKVLETAQGTVAVRSGELRDSGHVEVTETGKTVAAAVVFDSPHAVFVEFGTGQRGAASPGAGDGPYNPNWPGMAAIPFLRPAFDAHRDEAEGMAREFVGVALK